MLVSYVRNYKLDNKMKDMRASGAILSFSTGIPDSRLSKIRVGRIKPREDEKQKIANALECKVEDVFEQ
jgi:DNA-binding Xre family transcriptional regulator